MEVKQSLRYAKTRRFTGRRSITPMRRKQKKLQKTRSHKVERKQNVQLLQHTSAQHDGRRENENQNEFGNDSKWQGNQDSDHEGKWKDEEEYTQIEQIRDTENSKESIHPGPLQTVSNMSEQTAVHEETDKTEIVAEELSPFE